MAYAINEPAKVPAVAIVADMKVPLPTLKKPSNNISDSPGIGSPKYSSIRLKNIANPPYSLISANKNSCISGTFNTFSFILQFYSIPSKCNTNSNYNLLLIFVQLDILLKLYLYYILVPFICIMPNLVTAVALKVSPVMLPFAV